MNYAQRHNSQFLFDTSEEVLLMVQFLAYAYTAGEENRTAPMSDEQKAGGRLFFGVVEDKLKTMQHSFRLLEDDIKNAS